MLFYASKMKKGNSMSRTFIQTQQRNERKPRKVLISFPSYDQDSWEYKKNDATFLDSFLTDPKPSNRNQIWRPSVALANLQGLDKTYKDLLFDEYYLLWDEKENHKLLVDEIKEDIAELNPNLQLKAVNPGIKQPFDTKDVYQNLSLFLAREEFHRQDTQYYVNCTNGTTQIRNCLFLLTQTGQINALRIAPTPWKNHRQRDRKADESQGWIEDGRRTVKGSYTLEDPEVFIEAYTTIGEKTQRSIFDIIMTGIITKDENKVKEIARIIEKIAKIPNAEFRSKQSILITGETGVGKTQLAQNIAAAFGKKDNFIALNCATIRGADPNIQRIELFGCKKGAASGIDEDRDGALKKADGGVLFLDEIGELKPEMQAMLLTALDKGEFLPLGGDPTKLETSTFQLICGTNRDLEKLVEGTDDGQSFRRDLFNRINAWHFELDPIRKRRGDIQVNIRGFLKRLAEEYGMRRTFTKEAERRFVECANDETITWDGNFRELNDMITRMAILSDGASITKEIVEAEFDDAMKRYRKKKEMSNTARVVPAPQQCEPSPQETRLAYSHNTSLSPLESAELDLLFKTTETGKASSQKAICKIVYGDKLTPSGLTRRLKTIFNMRFARGRLERIKTKSATP